MQRWFCTLCRTKDPPKLQWNLEQRHFTQLLQNSNDKKRLDLRDFAELRNALYNKNTTHVLCVSECINLYSSPCRDLVWVPCLAPAIFGPWSVLLEILHALWETRLPKEQMPPGSVVSGMFKATLVLLSTAICCQYCKLGCLQVPQALKLPPGMKTQNWGTNLSEPFFFQQEKLPWFVCNCTVFFSFFPVRKHYSLNTPVELCLL